MAIPVEIRQVERPKNTVVKNTLENLKLKKNQQIGMEKQFQKIWQCGEIEITNLPLKRHPRGYKIKKNQEKR
nr:hypothetical protein [Mycoplasmopsis bovis]